MEVKPKPFWRNLRYFAYIEKFLLSFQINIFNIQILYIYINLLGLHNYLSADLHVAGYLMFFKDFFFFFDWVLLFFVYFSTCFDHAKTAVLKKIWIWDKIHRCSVMCERGMYKHFFNLPFIYSFTKKSF